MSLVDQLVDKRYFQTLVSDSGLPVLWTIEDFPDSLLPETGLQIFAYDEGKLVRPRPLRTEVDPYDVSRTLSLVRVRGGHIILTTVSRKAILRNGEYFVTCHYVKYVTKARGWIALAASHVKLSALPDYLVEQVCLA